MHMMSDPCRPRFVLLAAVLCLLPAVLYATIRAERVAAGLNRPVYVVSPPGDADRLFVLEQHTGRIRILNLRSGTLNATPFLDIDNLATGNEQGLLGMAFDPNYTNNGYVYLNLTVSSTNATEIRRYQVSPDDPNRALPQSNRLVMTYGQPFTNHNGGWIDFGPDGYLYIASGDGGSGNDPGNRSQDITNQKLGKLLRVDVSRDDFPRDETRNYGVPADNPFVGLAGDDEIWAFGLRNPWRCCFDRATGDLWIADVGQGQREEVHRQPADSPGGENYGWRVMEGSRCNIRSDALPCNDPSFVPPLHEYSHVGAPNGGFSITGGYVYRGPIQALQGTYFFADFVTEQIWSLPADTSAPGPLINWTAQLAATPGGIDGISSFGEDAAGNLYIVDLGGEVFRLVCDGELTGDFDRDCDVDTEDLALLAALWRSDPNDPNWDAVRNLVDGPNASIDALDLDVFLENWLKVDHQVQAPPSGRRR